MTRSERVLEARRMLKAGEFYREVTSIVADDLHWDRVTLSCGHWTLWNEELCAAPAPAQVQCEDCAKAWIKA